MSEFSYIYIISDSNGNLKIGVSIDPEKRIKQLSTGNCSKLTLEKVYCVERRMVYKLEKECHKVLQTHYPKSKEWFQEPLLFHVDNIIYEICESYLE